MTVTREITVAGQVRRIEQFSGRKVAVALQVVGRLADTYHNVTDDMARFREEYAAKNPIRLTRGQVAMNVAELRGGMGAVESDTDLSDEDRAVVLRTLRETLDAYQYLLDTEFQNMDVIERPSVAPQAEVMMAVAPRALEIADEQVAQLVGLALMTNHDVAQARRSGDLFGALQQVGDEALDTAPFNEIMEAVAAAAEMLVEDVQQGRTTAGKIGALFRPAQEEGSPEATPTEQATVTDPSTSTDSRPNGSTSSPPPTDGEPTTASTISPTDSVAVSAA